MKALSKNIGKLLIPVSMFVAPFSSVANELQVAKLKGQIVSLAESFSGQGDPDFSRQKALVPLVDELVKLVPQSPVAQRIDLIAGAWKQVWGPYDYRNDDRGVDPELGTSEIYQVVFSEGFYYNVSPNFPKGDRSKERIGLLRGEFSVSDTALNELNVEFTNFPGVSRRPVDVDLWELPAIAEYGELENKIKIVPTWLVKVFFKGGALEEVYTDSDLRILYGKNDKNFKNKALYIMTRVK